MTLDAACSGDNFLYYPYRVSRNIYMFQSVSNHNCIGITDDGTALLERDCDENLNIAKWKITKLIDPVDFFGINFESLARSSFCLDNAGAIVACDPLDPAVLVQFRDSDTNIIELV